MEFNAERVCVNMVCFAWLVNKSLITLLAENIANNLVVHRNCIDEKVGSTSVLGEMFKDSFKLCVGISPFFHTGICVNLITSYDTKLLC